MRPFTPVKGGTVSLNVTSTSSDSALNCSCTTLLLTNIGTKVCYVRTGKGSQTAVTGDLPLIGGSAQTITIANTDTDVAAICGGSDTTTLLVTPGYGI